MGGRGHGAGLTGLDLVCPAVKGEDPSWALNSAFATSQFTGRKEQKSPTRTHTASALCGLKCKLESVALSFLFSFFKSTVPKQGFFRV